MSGVKVAEYLNISYVHYYDIEKGKKTLNQEYLEKLSKFYDVSVDYLLGIELSEVREPITNYEVNKLMKVDPDSLIVLARAANLSEETKERLKRMAALEIEMELKKRKKDK